MEYHHFFFFFFFLALSERWLTASQSVNLVNSEFILYVSISIELAHVNCCILLSNVVSSAYIMGENFVLDIAKSFI